LQTAEQKKSEKALAFLFRAMSVPGFVGPLHRHLLSAFRGIMFPRQKHENDLHFARAHGIVDA